MITDCCLHSHGVVTQNKMYRGDGGGNNNQYCLGEEGEGIIINNVLGRRGREGIIINTVLGRRGEGIIIRETSK